MKATGKGGATSPPGTGGSVGEIVYRSANPSVVPQKRAQAIGDEIERIAAENGGRATPKAVVAAAKSKRSALHRIIWKDDDETAAYKHRVHMARLVMASITVQVNEVRVPAFVHVSSQPGYVPARIAYTNVDTMAEFIKMAKSDAIVFYRKWGRIRTAAGLTDIFDAVERALAQELGIVNDKTGTDS